MWLKAAFATFSFAVASMSLPCVAWFDIPKAMLELEYFKTTWSELVAYVEFPLGEAELWMDTTNDEALLICKARTDEDLEKRIQVVNEYLGYLKEDLKHTIATLRAESELHTAECCQEKLEWYNRCVCAFNEV